MKINRKELIEALNWLAFNLQWDADCYDEYHHKEQSKKYSDQARVLKEAVKIVEGSEYAR